MKRKIFLRIIIVTIIFFCSHSVYSQHNNTDSAWYKAHKNVIRYNLSGALLFGPSRYIVLGYERLVSPHQSFSVNAGGVGLPKLVSINTDSFHLNKDLKNKGLNLSIDYRFYLTKENKYIAPHGVYIGPYYSLNQFRRNNEWTFEQGNNQSKLLTTQTTFNIHTIGAELGYQFILWKRLALDFIVVGPGLSSYRLKATIDGNLSPANKEQLQDAVEQIVKQKFPGMNFVFADKTIAANGVLSTWSIGFRYMIHIGFNF